MPNDEFLTRLLGITDEEVRITTPEEVARIERERAARAAVIREQRANGPAARLRALAVGASTVFEQYKVPAQLHPHTQRIGLLTGATFKCERVPQGVKVTRTV